MPLFLIKIKKIIPPKILERLRPGYHLLLAFFSALFYGFPSRGLTVIGVTGTKGKTTVIELLHEILAGSGLKVASVSSLRFRVGEEETRNDLKMTMPGRFFLQKFLHQAKKRGCTHVILEVTSEGIRQFRHRFIWFDAAVMTNISPEHLERHGGFENYLRSKLDLFWRLSPAALSVINRDDVSGVRFSAATPAHKIFYGREGVEINGKMLKVKNRQTDERGIYFDLENQSFFSPLLGEFNFYNILSAVSVGLALHLSPEKMKTALEKVTGIPGRLEFIQKTPFSIVVDYAHTPDSLKQVYKFLHSRAPQGSLVCVLGSAGGGRDKWKRPELGKIASEFCTKIILTGEDPYDEDPEEIMDQISSGMLQKSMVARVLDRREAIRHALQSVKPGDTVVITGKGSECWMMGAGGSRIPWDDREIVRNELG